MLLSQFLVNLGIYIVKRVNLITGKYDSDYSPGKQLDPPLTFNSFMVLFKSRSKLPEL